MTQDQITAFVQGFFSEDVFVFDGPPVIHGDARPGVPLDWNSTADCGGGGSASFAGTMTLSAAPAPPTMEFTGVLGATGCTFTADEITITFDADPGLAMEGRFDFAPVEDVEDFSVSLELRSFGDFDWSVDYSWAAGEVDWSGFCPLDITLAADFSLKAIQTGNPLDTVTGTVCWQRINEAVDGFGDSVPYIIEADGGSASLSRFSCTLTRAEYAEMLRAPLRGT